MEFKIESNVPVPTNARSYGRAKYPLTDLKVGESFFVPQRDMKKAKNLRSTFAVRARKAGFKVVSIADADGVRVWRTA